MAKLPAVVTAYFRHMNAGDFAALPELFTDDAEFHAVGARPRIGRDDVLTYFPHALGSWQTYRDTVTRAVVEDDVVVTEIQFDGTDHRGRAVAFEAVDIFDLRDGRIARVSNWYDVTAVRRQLAG